MDLLCLLGRGDLASADGPDGLVSNNDLGPVASANLGLEGIQLLGHDRHGRASLTLLEGLTAAPDDADTVVDCVLGLGGDGLVRLAQDRAPLAVAENGPGNAAVEQLRYGNLTSEGTVGFVVDILGSNLDLLAQLLTDELQIQSWRCDNNLCQRR